MEIPPFEIGLLLTPGHTPGGTSFIIQEHIFTGDVLFQGTVGRTDLPGGDWEKLYKSLIKIMKEIPGHYICHPGHGSSTTIDKELIKKCSKTHFYFSY